MIFRVRIPLFNRSVFHCSSFPTVPELRYSTSTALAWARSQEPYEELVLRSSSLNYNRSDSRPRTIQWLSWWQYVLIPSQPINIGGLIGALDLARTG